MDAPLNALIAGYDVETTGLEIGDHRIIEVYIGLWRLDGQQVFAFEQRIHPERGIAVEAQRVHGIALSDLIGMPNWEAVAPKVQMILEKSTHQVAHNGAHFDKPFIGYELKRVGLTMPERPLIDTMIEGVWATPDGKRPTLQELCFAMGEDYDPAQSHAAAYDVQRMMACFFKGLKQGWFSLPANSVPMAA